MSNIYIQEPPTNGKVLLVTSVGDIDIELWSKECPKACRNFVQLCMEGYYDNTIFHRIVPDFIVQGGDPSGTGDGGESIYGKPFKDEIHSRLRFVRRGLVAMANAGRDDNSSQFFFTLGPTQELQGKHTLFGKVTGNTVYNMLKLTEVDIGADDRPVDPHSITKAKILHNPFDDIVPRKIKKQDKSESESKKKKSTAKATKNFKLLSFGEEAEEDEEENIKIVKKIKKKNKGGSSKSSHDLLDDHTLSTLPAVDVHSIKSKKSDKRHKDEDSEDEREAMKERIRKKLRTEGSSKDFLVDEGSSEEEGKAKSQKITELQQEAKRLKKELLAKDNQREQDTKAKDSDDDKPDDNEMVKNYKAERRKYKEQKKTLPKKGSIREKETLSMLASFQNKLSSLSQFAAYGDEEEEEGEEEKEEEEDDSDLSWMNHKLSFEEQQRKVIDANIKELDRYEIFDPRNPLTKRRREESKKHMKESKKT